MKTIAIRAEDKNRWERRAPLTPEHVAELAGERHLRIVVQPSARRVFADNEYERAGAKLSVNLSDAQIIMGVKEVPAAKILPEKVYFYFSHVIKGQAWNMPMLRRLIDSGCTLVEYERIVDDDGKRIVFFGRHAGYAGMIDTLWALGRRLAWEGFMTPLYDVRLAHEYDDLDDALHQITAAGDRIRSGGLPVGLRPMVFAFTGSGNVSRGAQEVFDRLPWVEISPERLRNLPEDRDRPRNVVYKTILDRKHRYERRDGGGFDAAEYERNPEAYQSALGPLLPHITVFINGIYWEPGHPRLITREDLVPLWRDDPQPKLRVIGDITCDVGGSCSVTTRATEPGDPVYVSEVESGKELPGYAGAGPVVMAVDNLPCELPFESSRHFGDSLMSYIPAIARCDWTAPLEQLSLPEELRRAIIVHKGELTPGYQYLAGPLNSHA
jgi:saccharopine dehydrogenase (NAD+, L-lysine forming)